MSIVEIAFVGYRVTDLARARAFYEETLGLAMSRTFGFEKNGFVEYDIGAGTLAIGNSVPPSWRGLLDMWKPGAPGCLVALEVDDFEAMIERLRAAGVTIVHEPAESPVCRMAVILDPDGNAVVIHKRHS